jgi:pyrrolidone-carboxylate peptidase
VIPVIIGATRTIPKSFRKYVSTIPVNQEVRELQKTAIFGTVSESADVKVHYSQRRN